MAGFYVKTVTCCETEHREEFVYRTPSLLGLANHNIPSESEWNKNRNIV